MQHGYLAGLPTLYTKRDIETKDYLGLVFKNISRRLRGFHMMTYIERLAWLPPAGAQF